jgi:transcriptional regulator with XRE-family HTH domain
MVVHYLRQHRERAGLTQIALAEKCGTFESVMSRFESGGRAISLEMAVRLCRGLNISLAQLLEPPPTPGTVNINLRVKGLKAEKAADFKSVVKEIFARYQDQ